MEPDLLADTLQPPTLRPAVSPSVHLSLTAVYTALYGGLFLVVYAQLWLILYYRHRRLSYQTVFLFLCLVWAALRITLFSFYYKNCAAANDLNTFLYWMLYCCPVVLQFTTLCLMVVFFAGVYFRSMPVSISHKYSGPLHITVILSVLTFLTTNITCAVILKHYDQQSQSVPMYIILIRVSISGGLFLLMSILLCVCIYKMSKVADTTVVLETKGLTVRQACAACIVIILLYTSRVVYNFIAISKPLSSVISFGYDWINVSDQADFENLNQGLAYISFGIVLFAWEFLPTFIVVLFFRVHKPDEISISLSNLPSESFSSRAYFFDDTRYYENNSVIDADGPFTINSTGSSWCHTSTNIPQDTVLPPNRVRTTLNVSVTPPPREEAFYDGT